MTLDTSTLDGLFDDDWNNVYKPLHVTDTYYSCSVGENSNCCSNTNNSALLDEVLTRQDIIESKIDSLEIAGDLSKITALVGDVKDISTNLKKLTEEVEDISTRLQNNQDYSKDIDELKKNVQDISTNVQDVSSGLKDVKTHQDEIDEFLNNMFHWENQKGEKL